MTFSISRETLADLARLITDELEEKYRKFKRNGSIVLSLPEGQIFRDNVPFAYNTPLSQVWFDENEFNISPVVFEPVDNFLPPQFLIETSGVIVPIVSPIDANPISAEAIKSLVAYTFDYFFVSMLEKLNRWGPNVAEMVVGASGSIVGEKILNKTITSDIMVTIYISFRKSKVNIIAKSPFQQMSDPSNSVGIQLTR